MFSFVKAAWNFTLASTLVNMSASCFSDSVYSNLSPKFWILSWSAAMDNLCVLFMDFIRAEYPLFKIWIHAWLSSWRTSGTSWPKTSWRTVWTGIASENKPSLNATISLSVVLLDTHCWRLEVQEIGKWVPLSHMAQRYIPLWLFIVQTSPPKSASV